MRMSEGRRWHQGRPIWYPGYMAIDVSSEFEAELESRLRSGRYRSAEELLREALHLVDERDGIREAVAQGVAEADRGEFVDGEEVINEARKLIRHKTEARHGGRAHVFVLPSPLPTTSSRLPTTFPTTTRGR
jgi:antitoxin ParD1/3/4